MIHVTNVNQIRAAQHVACLVHDNILSLKKQILFSFSGFTFADITDEIKGLNSYFFRMGVKCLFYKHHLHQTNTFIHKVNDPFLSFTSYNMVSKMNGKTVHNFP